MNWEKRAVDEVIANEDRVKEIYRKMAYLEHLEFEASLIGDRTTWFAEKLEELESELSDIQGGMKND